MKTFQESSVTHSRNGSSRAAHVSLHVKLNFRLKLRALETRNINSLLALGSFDDITVETYEPRTYDVALSVIPRVSTELTE